MNNSENSLTLKIYILLGFMSFIFLSVVDCSSISDIDSLTKVSEYKNPSQNPKDDTDPNKNPKLTSQEKWDQFIQSS